MNLLRRVAAVSLRIMPILAIALLSLSSPSEALAQSLTVGNCTVSTTSFDVNEKVCVSGTTGGNSGSDPARVCVVPPTGPVVGTRDDVTRDGCNEFPPASPFNNAPVWLPPTAPGSYRVFLFASDESVLQRAITIESAPNDNDGDGDPDSTDPDDDNDGIADAFDTEPFNPNNSCSGGDPQNVSFAQVVSGDISCAAEVSISVVPLTTVLASGDLRLIAPTVTFQAGFAVAGGLTVISSHPCLACSP